MKAVLKNDWYSIRYLILTLMFISVITSWLYSTAPEEGYFIIALPLIYASFLPPVFYLIDERVKWGRFASALPGSRSEYIHSKYISVIVSLTAIMIVTVIYHLITAVDRTQYGEQLPVLVLGFSASLISCSILLPVTLAFGSKAGIVTVFVNMTLYGVVAGFCDGMIENGELSIPDLIQSLIFLGAAVVFCILSWLISILIYNHKEL